MSFSEFVQKNFALDISTIIQLANEKFEGSKINLYAAGSGVLSYVMSTLSMPTFAANDLDLYVNNHSANLRLIALLIAQRYEQISNIADEYTGGFMGQNRIKNIITFRNDKGHVIQIVFIARSFISNAIDNFDLSVCSVGFNFQNETVYSTPSTANFPSAMDDIKSKRMHIRQNYIDKYSNGNFILHRRVAKYEQRGFSLVNRPPLTKALASIRQAIKRSQNKIEQAEDALSLILYKDVTNVRLRRLIKIEFIFGRRRENVEVSLATNIDGTVNVFNTTGNIYDRINEFEEDDGIPPSRITVSELLNQIIAHEKLKMSKLTAKYQQTFSGNIDITSDRRTKYEREINEAKKFIINQREDMAHADYNLVQYVQNVLSQFEEQDYTQDQKNSKRKLEFVRINGLSQECYNNDDRDSITYDDISNLSPDNTFRKIVFLPNGTTRIYCYDNDALGTWVSTGHSDYEYGVFPDTREPLDFFDYTQLSIIDRKRKKLAAIADYEVQIRKYESLLANIENGTNYDQAKLRGGAKGKKKRSSKKRSKRRSSKRSLRRKSPKVRR